VQIESLHPRTAATVTLIETTAIPKRTDTTAPNIVEMRDIVKIFPGVVALDHVDFNVCAGEIHGLVGKNGAGKSTLMGILSGFYQPDSGRIAIRGEVIPEMTTQRAKEAGIAIVPQYPQLVPSLSIAENMLCGSLPKTRLGFVDWKSVYAEADARLRRFGLDIDVRQMVEGLSITDRQMIDIANALFADASVIILDEPTAPLPKSEVEALFNFVRQQRERGASFIYISHYLEELFELCDRVTVLRNGKLVGTYSIKEIDQPQLVRLISGANIERFKRETMCTETPRVTMCIRGLTREPAYQDVNLDLHAGEIVGLTGLEGCGKDRLARGLFGLEKLGNGSVMLEGKPYRADSPNEALAQGVAYLPRDRHGYGIVGIRSVRENMTLSILRQLMNGLGFINGSKETELVQRYVETLGIKTTGLSTPVENLSGGNQQKVVVAKLVATKPKVLFLDEPTQGVDVQAKVEILKIASELARQGVSVVIISEEIGELLDTCDRILVMYRGKIIREFKAGDASTTNANILMAVEGTAQ